MGRGSKSNAKIGDRPGDAEIAMSTDRTQRGEVEDRILRPVMPELDTVRGIAILMVFLYHGFEDFAPAGSHVPPWERLFLSGVNLGWTGVNLFSGSFRLPDHWHSAGQRIQTTILLSISTFAARCGSCLPTIF